LVEIRIIGDLGIRRSPQHVLLHRVLAFVSAGWTAAVSVFGNDCHAFAAMRIAGVERQRSVHATAVEEQLRTVLEGVLDRVESKF
jgi:hypothetical protein